MSDTEYYRRGAGVTLLYEDGEAEDDALARMEWVVPVVFVAAGMMLLATIIGWWSPMTPFLLFVGLVWAPVSLAVVAASSDAVRPRNLTVAIAMLALFGTPLLAWNLGEYRTVLLWFGDRVLQTDAATNAVDDPSEQVATLACEMELDSGDPIRQQRLSRTLEDRPGIAVECLTARSDDEWALVRRLAAGLLESWYDGWMKDEPTGESRFCDRARHVPEVASLAGLDARPELLMCALDSNHDGVARCCGDVLTERADADTVVDIDPATWGRALHQSLFEVLEDAIEVPTSTLTSDDPYSQALGWRPLDLWHWTIELGCYLAITREDDEAGRVLSRLGDRQCGISPGDPRRSSTARVAVQRSCRAVVQRNSRIGIDQWCEASQRVQRRLAVGVAENRVRRAQLAMESKQLGEAMLDHFSVSRTPADSGGSPVLVSDGDGGIEIDTDFVYDLRSGHQPQWRARSDSRGSFRELTNRQYQRRHEIRGAMEQKARQLGVQLAADPSLHEEFYEQLDGIDGALDELERIHRSGPPNGSTRAE